MRWLHWLRLRGPTLDWLRGRMRARDQLDPELVNEYFAAMQRMIEAMQLDFSSRPSKSWTETMLSGGNRALVKQRVLEDPAYLRSDETGADPPLLSAIFANDAELVDLMLERGADPNAATGGETALLAAIDTDKPGEAMDILARLLEAGPDLMQTGTNGWMPMHCAAARGYIEKARLLLDAGAPVDGRSDDGDETPLMDAARSGHPEMVELLLAYGADPTIRNTVCEETAWDMARDAARGADPGIYELHLEQFGRLAAERYRREAHETARNGRHKRIVRILRKHGGSPCQRTK